MTSVLSMFQDTDPPVEEVAETVRTMDPTGARAGKTIRDTFDQLYDGQRTGRYTWDALSKTERAHFGSLLEINLARNFRFEAGEELDFLIAGHEIDCKFSESGQWMVPPISVGKLLLVVRAVDRRARFSMGVVRATEPHLNQRPNWDKKVTLSQMGKRAIQWIFHDHPFPPNLLTELEPSELARVFAPKLSGQKRLDELLRVAQGRRITSNVVATVAQQKDFMRRLRANGGARGGLRAEGYLVIVGDYTAHAEIARAFGVEVPFPGEAVSFRVVPTEADDARAVLVDGAYWRVAQPEEESTSPAPMLPTTKRKISQK